VRPGDVSSRERRGKGTVYPSFQPSNVERVIKSCDKFRSEQAILNGAKSRSALKWVERLDRRNRPRVDFILHYAGRMNDDRANKKNKGLALHN